MLPDFPRIFGALAAGAVAGWEAGDFGEGGVEAEDFFEGDDGGVFLGALLGVEELVAAVGVVGDEEDGGAVEDDALEGDHGVAGLVEEWPVRGWHGWQFSGCVAPLGLWGLGGGGPGAVPRALVVVRRWRKKPAALVGRPAGGGVGLVGCGVSPGGARLGRLRNR